MMMAEHVIFYQVREKVVFRFKTCITLSVNPLSVCFNYQTLLKILVMLTATEVESTGLHFEGCLCFYPEKNTQRTRLVMSCVHMTRVYHVFKTMKVKNHMTFGPPTKKLMIH